MAVDSRGKYFYETIASIFTGDEYRVIEVFNSNKILQTDKIEIYIDVGNDLIDSTAERESKVVKQEYTREFRILAIFGIKTTNDELKLKLRRWEVEELINKELQTITKFDIVWNSQQVVIGDYNYRFVIRQIRRDDIYFAEVTNGNKTGEQIYITGFIDYRM